MEISPVQTTTRADIPVTQEMDEAITDGLKIDADFDTFLSLLTAQLRNQDPLEPVDSTDFVAQLAQFSAVEQQVETNTALADILGLLREGDVASLASWLGASVQAAGPVYFDGSPVTLTTAPEPEATQSTLIVRDAAGDIIARQSVSSFDESVTWNGLTGAGEGAAEGLYSFTVESTNGQDRLSTNQAAGFSKVEEVRIDGDAPVLVLQGGDAIGLADILAVR